MPPRARRADRDEMRRYAADTPRATAVSQHEATAQRTRRDDVADDASRERNEPLIRRRNATMPAADSVPAATFVIAR